MPIILLAAAIMLVVTAYNDTYGALFSQIASDAPGFVVWGAALLILYVISKIPGGEKPAKALLALLVIVFLVGNRGVFSNFSAAITGQQAPVTPTPVQQAPLPQGIPIEIGGGSPGGIGGGGSAVGSVIGLATGML